MGEAKAGSQAVCEPAQRLSGPFHTLVSAAILAPSGDNMQPWRFEIDEQESSITVLVDETRDTSPMNAGQRMARIACGAALENIMRTAEHNGWAPRITGWLPDGGGVKVRIQSPAHEAGQIEECISQRLTSRVPYDGRPIPPEVQQQLSACQTEGSGNSMLWVTDRKLIDELATQIAECDAIMFGEPEFLRAFLENVRWDLRADEIADYGLQPSTLGLSALERAALPAVRQFPSWLIHSPLCRSGFYRKTSALVRSSSGMWVLVGNARSTQNHYNIGRLLERAWLRITAAGLAAQPMMSLPVLLSCQHRQMLSAKTSDAVMQIHDRVCELIGARDQETVAAVMRYGNSTAVRNRVGRRLVEEVTRWIATANWNCL